MQGVDRNLFFPHQFGKPAARQQFDLMAGSILLVDRIVGILPVIVITRLVIDLLMDVSPQRHVDLLHAAADTEDRQATGERPLDEGQIEQVAIPVLLFFWREVLLAVEGRIDVGTGAAQIDPIGEIQILLQIGGAAAGGYQQRDAAAYLHQRHDVFVGHHLIGVAVAGLGAHGHQHDRFTAGGEYGIWHRAP